MTNSLNIHTMLLYGQPGQPIFVLCDQNNIQISQATRCREIIISAYWNAKHKVVSTSGYISSLSRETLTAHFPTVDNFFIWVRFDTQDQLTQAIEYIKWFEEKFNLPSTTFEIGEWTKIILSSHWGFAPPLLSSFLLLLRESGLSCLGETIPLPVRIINNVTDISCWGKGDNWPYLNLHTHSFSCGLDVFSPYFEKNTLHPYLPIYHTWTLKES